MRPLANLLNQHGWTTRSILLPGFGPQFGTLFSRDYREWIEAAKAAIVEFQQGHGPGRKFLDLSSYSQETWNMHMMPDFDRAL